MPNVGVATSSVHINTALISDQVCILFVPVVYPQSVGGGCWMDGWMAE